MDKIESKNIEKATKLVELSIKERETLTQDELENLRMDIASIRYKIATEDLQYFSSKASLAELNFNSESAREFSKYYKLYQKKYTSKTSAESFARNTIKMSNSKTHAAHQEFLKAKDDKDTVYQILKSLDQISNAMSTLTKRAI